VGADDVTPWPQERTAVVKRKTTIEQPGASDSRSAQGQPAQKKKRVASDSSTDLPSRTKRLKQRKIPESLGCMPSLLLLVLLSLPCLFFLSIGCPLTSSQGADQVLQSSRGGFDVAGS
jgi:hypothetical protein